MFKRYLLTFVIFFAIDIIWLGKIAPKFYSQQIGHLMSPKVNWPAALIFYLIYIGALLIFVINPSAADLGWKNALLKGAFLGLAMYATYDLTNLATLKDWPVLVTVVDLLWGTFITASTCTVATLLIKKFGI